MRHGPHHSAQASTNTGLAEDASITSTANVASVTTCVLPSDVPEAWPLTSGSFAPHLPHTAWLVCAARSSTRFFVPHLGQTWIAIVEHKRAVAASKLSD